jgi:hypothetical protein
MKLRAVWVVVVAVSVIVPVCCDIVDVGGGGSCSCCVGSIGEMTVWVVFAVCISGVGGSGGDVWW